MMKKASLCFLGRDESGMRRAFPNTDGQAEMANSLEAGVEEDSPLTLPLCKRLASFSLRGPGSLQELA